MFRGHVDSVLAEHHVPPPWARVRTVVRLELGWSSDGVTDSGSDSMADRVSDSVSDSTTDSASDSMIGSAFNGMVRI